MIQGNGKNREACIQLKIINHLALNQSIKHIYGASNVATEGRIKVCGDKMNSEIVTEDNVFDQ